MGWLNCSITQMSKIYSLKIESSKFSIEKLCYKKVYKLKIRLRIKLYLSKVKDKNEKKIIPISNFQIHYSLCLKDVKGKPKHQLTIYHHTFGFFKLYEISFMFPWQFVADTKQQKL